MTNEEQNNAQAELLLKFKDEHEKTLVMVVVILSIVVGFLPSLIIWFLQKDQLSSSAQQLILNLLNFELTLLLCSLITFVPFLGWIISALLLPAIWIFNLLICLLLLSSISKNRLFKISFMLELIK